MIGFVTRPVGAFLSDPVGALAHLRDNHGTASQAGIALLALGLVIGIIDYVVGVRAFSHSVEPGGKRALGPLIVAFVFVVRLFAVAAMVWVGSRVLMRRRVPAATAFWMIVPFAGALLLLELIEAATLILFLVTGINVYGAMFFIGFGGALLMLILCCRVLHEDADWLGVLPLAFLSYVLGVHYAPLALLGAGIAALVLRER